MTKLNSNQLKPTYGCVAMTAAFVLSAALSYSQSQNKAKGPAPIVQSVKTGVVFEENKNQYPSQVLYKAKAAANLMMYLEKDRFTYVQCDLDQVEKIHDDAAVNRTVKEGTVDFHAFYMNFIGSNPHVLVTNEGKKNFYVNYFVGNDASKWASNVGLYEKVKYHDLYPGIDLVAYGNEAGFVYDYIVAAGADPKKIRCEFEGADGLEVQDGKLIIKTTTGNVIEGKPYSYQIINGIKTSVTTQYAISSDGQHLSFEFPKGYNSKYPLTIDPPIIYGASHSGVTPLTYKDFGFTASYGSGEFIFSGAECYGPSYPATPGSFQTSFGGQQPGSTVNMGISKLSPDASQLIWCTYVGGNSADRPNSLWVHTDGSVYILGSAGSANFPVTPGCFQSTRKGTGDICVVRLNATGSALLGSTYIGGSVVEGVSLPWQNPGITDYDQFKGEIIVDASGNAWCCSYTRSKDFPTTPGAFRTTNSSTYSTGADGVAFRFSPDMSTLQWSSYIGGDGWDACLSLRLNNAGELFVAGGAQSNMPVSANAYDPSFNETNVSTGLTPKGWDGFIAKFDATGSNLLGCSYFGVNANDAVYGMDLDIWGNPYIIGVSNGTTPVSPGVYSNPGGHVFIAKFKPDLSGLFWSTVYGGNHPIQTPSDQFRPAAFLVDSCENIYASGFRALGGFPVKDEYAPLNGHSFNNFPGNDPWNSTHMIKLEKDAKSLMFGSFWYGHHADGGSSRYTKEGILYLGICMQPGAAYTTPGAWDDNNTGSVWDMYVLKTGYSDTLDVKADGLGSCSLGSASVTVTGGTPPYSYVWSTNPIQTGQTVTGLPAGIYTVSVNDAATCRIWRDTVEIKIVNGVDLTPNQTNATCATLGSATVTATNGTPGYTYSWSSGQTTSAASNLSAGVYSVTVTDSNGCSTIEIYTITTSGSLSLTPSQANSTCTDPGSASITASAGSAPYTYSWSNGQSTNNATGLGPGTYSVVVTDATGCSNISIFNITGIGVPTVTTTQQNPSCSGTGSGSAAVTANGGTPGYSYQWSNGQTTNTATGLLVGSTYTVVVSDANGCSSTATVSFSNSGANPTAAFTSSTPCLGDVIQLMDGSVSPSGDTITSWEWQIPGGTPSSSTAQNPVANFNTAGSHTVSLIVTTLQGCKDTIEQQVLVYTPPAASFSQPDSGCAPICISYSDNSTSTDGNITGWQWSFTGGSVVSSTNQNPGTICYNNPGSYHVSLIVTSQYGCTDTLTAPMAEVYPWPKADFCVEPDKAPATNPVFTFCDMWSSDVVSWTWNFGDNDTDITSTDPVHSYASSATQNDFYSYQVCINVQNQYGCWDTTCKTVELIPEFEFYIPNTFTPNGDWINETFYGKSRGVKEYSIWIFDRWGNQIWDCHVEDENTNWDNGATNPKQEGLSSSCQWSGVVQPGGVDMNGRSNQLAQQDVYVWKVRLVDIFDRKHSYVGNVNVVR